MQHRFLKDWVLIGNFCLLRKTNIRKMRNVKKYLPSESLRLCSAGGRSESLTRKSFPWKQIRLWLTYAAALAGPAMLVVSEWCLTTLTLTVTNWLIWEVKLQGSFTLLWWFCSSPVFCFKNWSSIRILADPLHLFHHQAEVFPGIGKSYTDLFI